MALGLLAACAAPPGAKSPGVMGGLFGDEALIAAEVLRYGFPSTGNLRYHRSYVLSYDAAHRVPRWVAESLTPALVDGTPPEEAQRFRPDESLPEAVRTRNEDYAKSGYVRGRLASAANHRGNPKGYPDTFLLSNVAPQLGPDFRQTVWVELEVAVRAWARDSDKLYIVTGTLYLPTDEANAVRYPLVGDRGIAVPTHFFKVLLRERGKQRGMLAFLVPHRPTRADGDLAAYLVPVDRIEALAGLDFFPELIEPTQSEQEKSEPTALWPRTKQG
jgi:endonuclease G